MVVTLSIPIRKIYKLEGFITEKHLDNMAKVMLVTGMIVVYGYATEAFIGMRIVRGFSRERTEAGRYVRGNDLLVRKQLFVWLWTRVIDFVWDLIVPLASTALLLYGGYRILQGNMTLGDLTETTEQELLSSKNFGETSLVEIREMLTSKGLELGMFANQKREEETPYDPDSLSADERALLDRPISDLNLSVRARKCMVRLGLTTIGELVRRTGDDLLESREEGELYVFRIRKAG